jgi:hypothetical protein
MGGMLRVSHHNSDSFLYPDSRWYVVVMALGNAWDRVHASNTSETRYTSCCRDPFEPVQQNLPGLP